MKRYTDPELLEEAPDVVAARSVVELVGYKGEDRILHFTDYLLERANDQSHGTTFKSSFPAFDEKLGGLQTGEVVVVTGYTKNGKTLFAESWIHSMATNNKRARAAFFSFEVQTEKLLAKYVSDDHLPIFVPRQLKTMDFEWLKERCMEAKFKYNCTIILIDHLHFLVDMNTKQNMSLNIGAFMRRLKQEIAIGLDLAVILIAHQGQPKEGREADLGGIRDSSFVSQEADSVLIVSRKENYNAVDLQDFEIKYGEEKANRIRPKDDNEDKFSVGLATVKIACARRSGTYDYKKLFVKEGHFLQEV